MEALFDLEKYLRDLEEIVNIDSGSDDLEGCSRMVHRFADWYGQAGFDVVISGGPGTHPTMEARHLARKGQGIDILFMGHLDTVFPKGTAARRPFRVEDGIARGPGAADMKSGALLSLYLAKAVAEQKLPVNLCAVYNSDEELGSADSAQQLKNLGARSGYCFNFEGGREEGAFIKQRKEAVRYRIAFQGISAHAGIEPEKGASAIVEMGRWIESIPYLNAAEKGTTLNTGLARGGTAAGVVAEEAELLVELRYLTEGEKLRIEKSFDDMAAYPRIAGVKTTWEAKGGFPPMFPDENTEKLITLMKEAAKSLGQETPKFVCTGGGSDANHLVGLPVSVMDGCGPKSGRYHSEEEYLAVDSLRQRFELLYETIREIAGR